MARMSSNGASAGQSSRNNHSRNASKSSGSTSFTQSFRVVEGRGGGDASIAGPSSEETAQRFKTNSEIMAQRAIQDTRDTLLWVSKFGLGPADRVLLRQAVCAK